MKIVLHYKITQKMIEKRSLCQILLHDFLGKRRETDNRLEEKSVPQVAAKYCTTGFLILVVAVATGVLLDRCYICYSK